jgi:hypothetical protein
MADQYIIQPGSENERGLDTIHSKAKTIDVGIAPAQRFDKDNVSVEKDSMNYDRIDKEVAKYAGKAAIDIPPVENYRLKRLADKRVLSIMAFTYFLQALDRGTIGFASIMNIIQDTHLVGQQVRPSRSLATRANRNKVRLVDNLHLYCYRHRRVSFEPPYPARPNR